MASGNIPHGIQLLYRNKCAVWDHVGGAGGGTLLCKPSSSFIQTQGIFPSVEPENRTKENNRTTKKP